MLFPVLATQAQTKSRGFGAGMFSMGSRNTLSFFSHGEAGNTGTGLGGQFRIQLSDHVNTEWFADYITGNSGDLAYRSDYHIGWSVMYYLRPSASPPPFMQPYVLAGHCFDYTKLQDNHNRFNFAERWSSAVQAGIGNHFNLSERFDISSTLQYMIHLGTDVDPVVQDNQVHFVKGTSANLEGHVLFNVSLNYKIGHLW